MATKVTQLKDLLFDTEQARLVELARRLELLAAAEQQQREAMRRELDQRGAEMARERERLEAEIAALKTRVGTDAQLEKSVAGVLDGSFREAEKTRNRELARAMSPMVVRTVETELVRAQSRILAALVPHTGKLVKDYVQTAMRELIAEINSKLERGLTQSPWMLRLRSLITGRPIAELALAEMAKPKVSDIFLIRRGSGELMARWPQSPALANSDVHLSGVLANINEFALTAFKDGDGGEGIGTFTSGNSTVFLRATPTMLLAARVSGPAVPGAKGIVDDTFYESADITANTSQPETIDATGTDVVAAAEPPPLDRIATTLGKRLVAKHAEIATPSGLGFNPLLVVALLIALPIAAWLAWSFYVDYLTYSTRTAAARVVAGAGDLRLLSRPDIEVGPMGQTLKVTALAPTDAARQELVTRLHTALPGTEIEDDIKVLPPPMDLSPQIKGVQRELTSLEADLRARLARTAMDRAIARGEVRLQGAVGDLARAPTEYAGADRLEQLAAAKGDAAAGLDQLRAVRSRTAGNPTDPAQSRATVADLSAATNRILKATVLLDALLAGRSVGPIPTVPPTDDPLAASEALATASERLAAVTLLAVQALSVKPAAPPPPPPPAPEPHRPSPREELETFARQNAVFFSANADYRDPAGEQSRLKELARLMAASGDLVRVVGYTDERGGPNRNQPLAKDRADKVAADLIALGVPAARIVSIGRPIGIDISPAIGQSSPNRRVEFEVGFIGEGGAPP